LFERGGKALGEEGEGASKFRIVQSEHKIESLGVGFWGGKRWMVELM
jgi:hypothetical protein